MPRRGTESEFELTTIDRLELLDYEYVHGIELERPGKEEVVLRDRLRGALEERYGDLPADALDEAVRLFSRPEGVDTLRRNKAFQQILRNGVELPYEREDGTRDFRHVYAIDWEKPEKNDFLVVNQLSIQGQNDRRPDLVVYVNGLPLVLFELKSPRDEYVNVDGAFNQVRHYAEDIPQLFDYNALVVLSDQTETLHGVWTAPREHFSPWKSIDGEKVEATTTGSMKTLIEGLFTPERLLSYLRDFIVFDVAGDKITKMGAKYHQFFAVQKAVDRTLEAYATPDERRIGVIWHTTGSGKSLSMVFLVGILRRQIELENPTFVVQVDRSDLDNQLHDRFVACRSLVGTVKQADSTDDLRSILQTEGGEVVFTTIEKFRLKKDEDGVEEVEHPVLSTRRNVIVIADEAHRSQYGFTGGYARYLAEALPGALRLGFTGTPISFSGADTVEVFGHYIHTYDIRQSQLDGATVPIYYEARQVKLRLTQEDIDAALEEISEGADPEDVDRKKGRWAALAHAAGSEGRLNTLARDLLEHFRSRTETIEGKAMVVCMTRANCVGLYDALTALPECPEVRVVMTGNLAEDPPEWSEAGHITTKRQRNAVKQRMLDTEDPLEIVIVCDMWLTGTDIPCLHTLYVDKPMKGHNIIQAISRVNRTFRDKPHGVVVDYIGIGDELRAATATYSQGGGKGVVAESVSEEAKPVFFETLHEVRGILPQNVDDWGNWRQLSRIDFEDRCTLVYGYLTESVGRREHFLEAEHKLSKAFLLVKHRDDCRPHADEVAFFQQVRKQLWKTKGKRPFRDLDHAVRDLLDDSIESEGVVDIFAAAGIERADISILDDEFLQTFKDQPQQNLRLKLLEQLVRDELKRRERQNLAQSKSFQELLENTLQKYHNRLIDAAAVIQAMVQIREGLEAQEQRAEELGLEEEEVAFYDAIAKNLGGIYDHAFLRPLVHDVVQAVKSNLKVDWTESHREDVKAGVRFAVKRVLTKNGIEPDDFGKVLPFVMKQAEETWKDWGLAA